MRIALIGYGTMGRLIEAEATAAGHEVPTVVRSRQRDLKPDDELLEQLEGNDVAIDFSAGEAVLRNIEACARAGVPLVEGTTGWKQHESEAKQFVTQHSGAMVY